VEAFYLEQGLMDQRAFAAAFDATFVQASPRCTATVARSCADLRGMVVLGIGWFK
jgi:hypothetical protein